MKYFAMMMLPVHFGFCWDEKTYLKEMKRLGVKDHNPFQQKVSAKTEVFTHENDMDTIIVVLVEKSREPRIIYPLLCHEAVHAWEGIKKAMRTEQDHEEFKAYTIQYLVQLMIGELEKKNAKKR